MSFPHEDQETLYKKSLNDVAKMLKSKHGENYMVRFDALILGVLSRDEIV